MDSLLISIPSYKRPEMCRRIVNECRREVPGAEIRVHIDGYQTLYDDLDATQSRFMKPAGREYFWILWNAMLLRCMESDADTFLFLADDLTPAVPDAIQQTLSHLDHCDVIVPLYDQRGRGPQWVPVSPVDEGDRWLTHWVDGCFACRRDVLGALSWAVPPIPDHHFETNQSSGVGKYMSLAFHELGFRVCQVGETLYHHGDHESVMHPEHRRENPL